MVLKMNAWRKTKEILFLLVAGGILSACGGGSGNQDSKETSVNNDEKYLSSGVFSSYFNNKKSELQTTQEFNYEQQQRLAEISSAQVVTKITRGNYDADTGYASFRLEFNFHENEKFKGPTYTIYSSISNSSYSSISTTYQSSDRLVFTSELEEFYLYSEDSSLITCTNSKNSEYMLYKTTICDAKVYVERDKLYDYNYHVLFDIEVDSLDGYVSSSSYSTGGATNYYRSNDKYLPAARLKSISIIDKDTDSFFGTFYPQ